MSMYHKLLELIYARTVAMYQSYLAIMIINAHFDFLIFFSGVFINRKYYYLGFFGDVEPQFNPDNRVVVLFCKKNCGL